MIIRFNIFRLIAVSILASFLSFSNHMITKVLCCKSFFPINDRTAKGQLISTSGLAVARSGLVMRYPVSRWAAALASRIFSINILFLRCFSLFLPSFFSILSFLTVRVVRDPLRFSLTPCGPFRGSSDLSTRRYFSSSWTRDTCFSSYGYLP